MKTILKYLSNPYLALLLGLTGMILAAPKWTLTIAPWIGLPFFLYFTRQVKVWKVLVFGISGLLAAGFIGMYEVFPAPLPILLIILLIGSLKSILPYLIDRLSGAAQRGFWGTLIFPAALVSLEYLNTLDSGDVWSSVANTQYGFPALQQIASLFGIWGITFLIGWFASLMNWMAHSQWKWHKIQSGVLVALSFYTAIILYGVQRIHQAATTGEETVLIAGITRDNTLMMETLYHDEFGKSIRLTPETSQSSPELQEANRAMIPFIEDPFNQKYDNTRKVMDDNIKKLFAKTAELADKGVKIIAWSEAIGLTFKTEEQSIIKRAQALAGAKDIYLFISLGVINPGPYTPERLLLVNKTIALTPEGSVANVYLKSNPVPFAEQDYGSDDIIPLIASPYGKLSPVICYDADFPHFMKQAGKGGTDILILPSGDWKAIDPYHAYMASIRGIENGMSILRPVSRATSMVTNPVGAVLASDDFYTSEDRVVLAKVPTKGLSTLYTTLGDVVPYACLLGIAILLLEKLLLFSRLYKNRNRSFRESKTSANPSL